MYYLNSPSLDSYQPCCDGIHLQQYLNCNSLPANELVEESWKDGRTLYFNKVDLSSCLSYSYRRVALLSGDIEIHYWYIRYIEGVWG